MLLSQHSLFSIVQLICVVVKALLKQLVAGNTLKTAWSKSFSLTGGQLLLWAAKSEKYSIAYPSQKKDRIEKGSCHDLDQVLMGLDKKLIWK